MKALLLMLLWSLAGTVSGQKMDTITVSTEGTTYLIFDEPITLFNIGSSAYIAKAENERMLFVKAVTSNAQPTTLLIQFGSGLFTGYLRYRPKLNKNYYDYRKNARSTGAASTVNTSATGKLSKIRKVGANQQYTIATKDGISFECTNIYNDAQNTFLRFSVKNTTTIAFVLDMVSFTYNERIPRRLRNKVAPQIQEMTPTERVEPARIGAGRKEDYLYTIPLYSTTERGYLEVIIRESAGARVVVLTIPAKAIMKAPLI